MIKRTSNPCLIFNEKDLSMIEDKLIELDIEVISSHERELQVSLHIYGEDKNINKLVEWLDTDYQDIAEMEF